MGWGKGITSIFSIWLSSFPGFPGGSVGKEFPCNAGDTGEVDSIPESGRSPGGGHGNPLQYFAWRIPWTEEPGRLQSIGSQRVRDDWRDWAHMCIQFSKYHLFSFLIEWCWHSSQKSVDNTYMFISVLSILFHWCVCLFLCQYYTIFNDCSFMVSFEVEKRESSDFLSSIVLMVDLITEIDRFWDVPDFSLRDRNDSTNIVIRKNKTIMFIPSKLTPQ